MGNRFVSLTLGLIFLRLGAVSAADADVRAVQTRLKEAGFYFGEANGVYNSETSTAVSRYQIRNGLPITGQLDAQTRKALGVATALPSTASTERETWRQLRKTDQRFLENLKPKQNLEKAKAPNESGYSSVFVLSRERLRDYVAAFVLAGVDPQVGAELEFFADRVRYFNEGIVGREKIRRDLQRYAARWPQRSFSLAGEIELTPQPDSRLRVTFPLHYELRNGSKHSSGKVRKTLVVEVTGEDLQIVAVDEAKAK